MSRWYPNADGKCTGSFTKAIAIIQPDGKVRCHHCGRHVGFRNRQARIMAQHQPEPAKAAKCQQPNCNRRYADHTGETATGKAHRCPNTALTGERTFLERMQTNES